jgi:hypothetical protein
MLRQFERRAFDYMGNTPLPATKLDWLALMQHHGSPTRLLDFSHSFYVAAFFAMETAQGDAAVWAVNYHLVGNVIAAKMGVETGHENLDHRNARHAAFLEPYLALQRPPEATANLVVPIEPDRLHRRLTVQQGFFLCPTDLPRSFEDNLLLTLGLQPEHGLTPPEVEWDEIHGSDQEYGAIRIVLPRDIHKDALEDLHKMNVTAATLFPGLDGFARSMSYHVRAAGR